MGKNKVIVKANLILESSKVRDGLTSLEEFNWVILEKDVETG